MARQRAVRPGARWQPGLPRRPRRPVAGRRQWQLPAVQLPRLEVRWRRLALPVVVLLLAMAGGWWLYRSPPLSIRGVAVEGNVVLPPDGLREIAGLDGQSLVRPDFDGARERLLALPMVKEAEVSRDWPFGARITIVERTPWGVWQVGGLRYAVDEEGVVLDLPPPEGAPVVVQSDATQPLRAGDRVDTGAVAVARELVASAEQTVGRPVVALEFSQASGLTAVLDGDLRVTFGDARGYEFKLAALFAVLQRAEEQGLSVHRVDLRFGDRVAVQ